jgi:hypothetical protein
VDDRVASQQTGTLNMKTMRIAALAAMMGGAALGLAAPVSAELLDGTYQRSGDGPAGSTMSEATVVVTSCGAACKNLAGTLKNDEVVQLHLVATAWTGTNSFHDALTIDNNSLTGTETGPFIKDVVNYRYVKVG